MNEIVKQQPDAALQRRWILHHDAAAFAELSARHAGMVYGTCLRILHDATDAEDATQECFLKLAHSASPARTSFAGWLHRLAVNTSINFIRTNTRLREREGAFMRSQNSAAKPTWDDVRPHIDEAMAALSPRLRDALVLSFFEGKTQDEIGRELGITRSAVAHRVRRGLTQLRYRLERRGIDISMATLSGFLGVELAGAHAPTSLLNSIQQQAAAGYGVAAPTTAVKVLILGGTLMSKKILAGVAIVAMVVLVAILGTQGILPFPLLGGDGYEETDSELALANAAAESNPQAALQSEADSAAQRDASLQTPEQNDMARVGHEDGAMLEITGESGEPRGLDTLAPPASVSGSVFDRAALPVKDASVRLDIMGWGNEILKSYSTTTDEQGMYQLAGVDVAGGAQMSAVAEGYRSHVRLLQSLEAGQNLEGVDFTIAPGANPVRGVVVAENGDPVAAARVSLMSVSMGKRGHPSQTRPYDTLSMTLTSAEGAFELFSPQPGHCDLKVDAKGYPPQAFTYIKTGTNDARLVLAQATGVITGTVMFDDGNPAADYFVNAIGGIMAGGVEPDVQDAHFFTMGMHYAATDDEGNYRIDGLRPEEIYNVTVHEKGAIARLIMAPDPAAGLPSQSLGIVATRNRIRVEADAPTKLDIVIQPEAIVAGIVRDTDSGAPLPSILIFARPVEMSLVMAGKTQNNAAVSDEEGRFSLELDAAQEQEFELQAYYQHPNGLIEAEPGTHMQRARLTPGKRLDVEIRVDKPISIPVKVVDGDGSPLPGMLVGVGIVRGPQNWNYSWSAVAQTDSLGKAHVASFSPRDTYFVYVESPYSRDAAWDGRYFEQQILATSGEVKAIPGGRIDPVVLTVEPKGGIEATLVTVEGEPVADTPIHVFAGDGAAEPDSVVGYTDNRGYLAIVRAFPPATYPRLVFNWKRKEGTLIAIAQDVDIAENGVTDLGQLTLTEFVDEPSG